MGRATGPARRGRRRTSQRGRDTPVNVRPARDSDCSSIARIYNDAVRHTVATFDVRPRTLVEQQAWLGSHDARHPVVVAQQGARILGWASLSPWSDRDAYRDTAEFSFYVDARYRGRGVGRQLIFDIVRRSRRAHLHTLLARIAGENRASVHLHRSAGFHLVGRMHEVGRKFGRRIDVRLFELVNPV